MSEVATALPWQRAHWQRLTAAIREQRLSHALLLAGPGGVGKRHFAQAFCAYLLCEARQAETACGQCRGCVQRAAGSHPNLSLLSPEEGKRDIGVDAVRETIAKVSVSSHYAQAKLVIVDPADQLSLGAVNALLKTLEEPPKATHFLLISQRPALLPATVRSRTQLLRFPVPPREDALAWLARFAPQVDDEALDEAGGAPLRALAWLEDGRLEQRRAWAQLLEAVASRRQSPLAAAGTVAREQTAAFFEWLADWCVRGLRAALSGDPRLPASVYEQFSRDVYDAIRALSGNANAQLTVESTMMRWLQLSAQAQRAGRG